MSFRDFKYNYLIDVNQGELELREHSCQEVNDYGADSERHQCIDALNHKCVRVGKCLHILRVNSPG